MLPSPLSPDYQFLLPIMPTPTSLLQHFELSVTKLKPMLKKGPPVVAKKTETGLTLCESLCSQVCETNHLHTIQVQQAVANATANFAVVDSGADTCLLGEEFHIIHHNTMRTVEVLGFNNDRGKETGKHLGSGICAIDLPSKETILLQVNEGVVMQTGKTLLSVNQVRHFGHVVDDCPRKYGGKQAITTTQGHVLPLSYCGALCRIALRKPTRKELASIVPQELTDPMEWKPMLEYDSDASIDHSLANVNQLSPVHTGEGVLLLKLKMLKISTKITLPSQKTRLVVSVARKHNKKSTKSS